MADRSHLSIGEVLSLLQDEFPDVTISKIRFLESQGLLDPERTPSGYRKFYEPDIDQLRWILRQQRENFLPLKVIKDRLAEVPLDELLKSDGAVVVDTPLPIDELAAVDEPITELRREPAVEIVDVVEIVEVVEEVLVLPIEPVEPIEPAAAKAKPDPPAPPPPATVEPPTPEPAVDVAVAEAPPAEIPRTDDATLLDVGETSMNMTADELTRATGLTARQLTDLETYGLITPETIGHLNYYGDDALIVGRTAAAFMRHGVEARHLRMYKVAAERESGFLEQLIMPLLKQRNPATRRQAVALLDDLVGLGDTLRQAMLRQAMRDHLERR